MDTPPAPKLNLRVPALTLLMVGGALLVAAFPGWSAGLIYDRQAVLKGEIWRLFTGHWVHFSPSHLGFDLLALGLAGWMIQARGLPNFGWLCLLAPWGINLALLTFVPDLRQAGGLSGLATCFLVYLALDGWGDTGLWHWVCGLTLAGVVGKILLEWHTGHLLLATVQPGTVVVSTASHVAGALAGLMFYRSLKPLDFRMEGGQIRILLRSHAPEFGVGPGKGLPEPLPGPGQIAQTAFVAGQIVGQDDFVRKPGHGG
jgi:rhomboid family GlyGly-CTERM serine protease